METMASPLESNPTLLAIRKGTVDGANLRTFILAGDSIFTVENEATGGRFTFKVSRADGENPDRPWFVGLLAGPDNTSDYRYMGCIFEGAKYVITRKSWIAPDSPSQKAFMWLWLRVASAAPLPSSVKVYHMGRCGRCGRPLTVPESIRTGLGPVCAGKV